LLHPSTVDMLTAMLAQPSHQDTEWNNLTTGTGALSRFLHYYGPKYSWIQWTHILPTYI